MSGCKKDEKEKEEEQVQIQQNGLVGTWRFREANMLYSIDGVMHNAMEEGADLSSLDGIFDGFVFKFNKNNTVTISINENYTENTTYTVSSNRIYIKDSEGYVMKFYYRFSDKILEFYWTLDDLIEQQGGELPEEFEIYDSVEFVFIFDKIS
jgi:hypothetical protein